MSKTNSGPSLLVIVLHLVLVLMTGGWWLLPLFIHYCGPRISGRPASVPMTFVHAMLSTFTGGLWFIGLIIYWFTRK